MNSNIHNSLKKLTDYVIENSQFYKKHFSNFLNLIDDFSIESFKKLPFTNKSELAENNIDFLCIPKNEIADFVCTSGTTGKAVSVYLSENDLSRLAFNEYSSFLTVGASSNDVFQLMTTMDKKFMAGLAYYLGARKLKAGFLRMGPGNPSAQWDSIFEYNSTILIAVPSFILKCLEFAVENNINYKSSSVKKIICIGEPIRNENLEFNALGKRIKDLWDIELYSTYASTEMGAAFTECEHGLGAHLNEDLLYLEVIDDNSNPVVSGQIGELIISTLNVEGTPLVRFRTGDLAHVYYEPCKCGRNSPRIGPIVGRKNQMIKFKGTTIFPATIFEVLNNFQEIKLFQVEVQKDSLGMDNLTIIFEDEMEFHESMFVIINELNNKLRVKPCFAFLPYNELFNRLFTSDSRKAQKIIFK